MWQSVSVAQGVHSLRPFARWRYCCSYKCVRCKCTEAIRDGAIGDVKEWLRANPLTIFSFTRKGNNNFDKKELWVAESM